MDPNLDSVFGCVVDAALRGAQLFCYKRSKIPAQKREDDSVSHVRL